MKFKIIGMVLAALLSVNVLHAASNKRMAPKHNQCQVQADFAAEVFDLIAENPRVILSGDSAADANSFAFIRQWVRDGKSRNELLALVWSDCPDAI